MSKTAFFVCAALLTAGVSAPAHAELLNFDLSGSRSAMFQLDSNPTPSSFSSIGSDEIVFSNVTGTFAGVAGTASTIEFGIGGILADLNITEPDIGFTQFSGRDLFGGTAAAPVFSVGSFNLTSIVSGASTLSISVAPVSSAPEPSTWALLIAGVAMVGAALRSGRRRMTSAFAR